MAFSSSKNEKCCLSCANWGGFRKVNYAKRAETDSPGTRGKCHAGVNASCVSPGPTACHDGKQCNKYQTWSALL